MSLDRMHRKDVLFALCVALVSLAVRPASAEELVLKDGQRIVGLIVGFENGMFRVETNFGVALVRKDKLASVNFEGGQAAEAATLDNPGKSAGSGNSLAGSKQSGPRLHSADFGGREGPPALTALSPDADHAAVTPEQRAANSIVIPKLPQTSADLPEPPALDLRYASAAAAPAAARLLPGPPGSRPVDEPLPAALEERVEGNTYLNETFRFAMYKPPGWKVFEGVPRETGSGIMAMGTEDEQTVLFVDREMWSGPPDLKAGHAEDRFRKTYQEFQKLSEATIQLAGCPAIRRTFKGVVDGVEWHGVSVHLARGNIIFAIVGLTSAETYQFQQAIFSKIINSFRFFSPGS